MSKILALWCTVYFGGLAMALIHPIYPLVSYLTFYYMPPHVNWWGRFVPDLRFSLLASAVLAASIFLKNSSLERLKSDKNPALPWLLLFGLNTVIVTLWALDRVRSWNWTVTFLKLILLYLLIPAAVRTPAQFDLFSAAHIGGATYWGYKAWDDPTRENGRLKDVGGPDSQNENLAAAHLLTVLPFVAVYALSVRRKWLKGTVVVCGAFIVNVFILCNSRGGTVGLLAMVGGAILLAGKGRRLKLLSVAAAGLIAVFLLADNDFIRRQQTTSDPQDGAAQGRLIAWQAGLRVIRDYPLGGGGRAFHILSPQYIPEIVERSGDEERSVHNTYLHLGAEWGIQGLILWLGFMGTTFVHLHASRKRARHDSWYYYRFLAIELALIGTLTAGIFGNRLYGESVYWMCALGVALRRMHATATADEPAPVAEPGTPLVVAPRPAPVGA
jgi:probable O-glycosylation ligase (exosortase A-associated)